MFDLTDQVKLSPKLQQKYILARVALHVVFLFVLLLVAHSVLFPSVTQDYFFAGASSLKNTLTTPIVKSAGTETEETKSLIKANESLSFDATPFGLFSDVTINFAVDEKSKPADTVLTLRKSYQAFFYPAGAPLGFKDGSLLTANGAYYMISDGFLRKFANPDIVSKLGYAKDAFLAVDARDLKYNQPGADITDANIYPDNSLFVVDNKYYLLKDQQLLAFISPRAFLSQFENAAAINKDHDFLAKYPLSETAVGFADGTLASSDQSVFILSNGKSYPIINAQTFQIMGFNWNDIVALDPEELGLYERQKQFTDEQPHPNGTLFLDQKTNQYFMIENGLRRPILSAKVVQTYSKQKPVLVDSQSLEKKVPCTLKKQLFHNIYTCTASLDSLNELAGNDFKIQTTFAQETKLSEIHATFSTPLTWPNMRDSLSVIKNKIISNYISQ